VVWSIYENEYNICKCTKSKVAMVASWTLLQTARGPQNKCWVEVNGSYDSNPSAAANRYHLTLNCPRKELILYSVSSGAVIRCNSGKWKLLATLLQLKCIWEIIICELKFHSDISFIWIIVNVHSAAFFRVSQMKYHGVFARPWVNLNGCPWNS
jgi:hypothetical protein